MKRPIHIIGGGLAGLSLGIALRQEGIETTLIEAGNYPRHRVCGEFISGISDEMLDQLGIAEFFTSTQKHSSSGWYYQDRLVFASELPRQAYGISRYRLDYQLVQKFEALGGNLITGSRYKEDANEGYIYASGRPRSKASQWIGLKCHLLDYDSSHDLEMHLGEGVYIGFSEVEGGRTDACGLFKKRSGIKSSKTGLMTAYLRACGLNRLAEKVTACAIDETSCLGVNAFDFGWQPEPNDSQRLRIGDQFAIIAPFSGNGMSMAFEGAAEARGPVIDYSQGEVSWQECCDTVSRALKKRFQRRIAISKMVHPFLTDASKQKVLLGLGQLKLIPFGTLFKALR